MASTATNRGQAKQLVLLHGWGMSSAVWDPVLDRLQAHYRVVAMDLPGHGRHRAVPLEGLDACVGQLASWLPVEPVPLLGWSLGGLVALRFAQQYPERVSSLLMMASSPCFVKRKDWVFGMDETVFRQFQEGLERDYQSTLKRFLGLQLRGMPQAKSLMVQLREQMEANAPDRSALVSGLQMLEIEDLRDALADLEMPVSMLLGERDTLVPSALAEVMRGPEYGLDVCLVQGAGHIPFLTHPDEFDKWVSEHVD